MPAATLPAERRGILAAVLAPTYPRRLVWERHISNSPDFYEILGVARTDSRAEIRAAYLALMKRVHPDLSGRERAEAEAWAKRINEAFAVLRDPAKRALYDVELDRNGAGTARREGVRFHRPAAPAVAVPAQVDPRKPARRRGAVRGLLLILLLAGAVLAGTWHYRDRLRDAPLLKKGEGALSTPPRAREEAAPYERPIIDADIVDAIADSRWVLDYGTAEDAIEHSRGCFDELRTYPTMRLLDRCIAFDFAWKHQLKEPALGGGYFAAPVMMARHLGNARALPDSEGMNEERLESLEALTIATLARLTKGPSVGSGDGG